MGMAFFSSSGLGMTLCVLSSYVPMLVFVLILHGRTPKKMRRIAVTAPHAMPCVLLLCACLRHERTNASSVLCVMQKLRA
jgi:hypothetical protein